MPVDTSSDYERAGALSSLGGVGCSPVVEYPLKYARYIFANAYQGWMPWKYGGYDEFIDKHDEEKASYRSTDLPISRALYI